MLREREHERERERVFLLSILFLYFPAPLATIDRPNKPTHRAEHGLHQPEDRGRHQHLDSRDRAARAGLHLRRKGQRREEGQEEDVRRRGEDSGAEGEARGPV